MIGSSEDLHEPEVHNRNLYKTAPKVQHKSNRYLYQHKLGDESPCSASDAAPDNEDGASESVGKPQSTVMVVHNTLQRPSTKAAHDAQF